MSDFIIREYTAKDIPALTAIWEKNFGDSLEFISQFFRILPDMGTGLLAVSGAGIAGAAYILTGQKLVLNEYTHFTAPVVGYIYAVAVDDKFRHHGIGAALTAAAARKGRERGAEIISTLPAKASLYRWYADIISTKHILRRKKEIIKSEASDMYMPLSSGEYMLRRENMLNGIPHLQLSTAGLEFERIVCASSGGGFYAVGDGIAAAYKEGERGIIQELICSDPSQRYQIATSLGAALGVEELILWTPAQNGEAYIAADDKVIYGDIVWNLSFD